LLITCNLLPAVQRALLGARHAVLLIYLYILQFASCCAACVAGRSYRHVVQRALLCSVRCCDACIAGCSHRHAVLLISCNLLPAAQRALLGASLTHLNVSGLAPQVSERTDAHTQ
jgi:hypothetical protein